VAYGLSIGTKFGDLEWRNGRVVGVISNTQAITSWAGAMSTSDGHGHC